MGIQPIDLQTMYSQMSNVSKAYSGQQQVQLTEAMQQQNNIQNNLENTKKVQQTSNEKGITKNISENGGNSSGAYGKNGQKKKYNEKKEDADEITPPKSDYSYIGTIIDITR